MTEYATLREKIAAEKAERAERYAAFENLFAQAHEAGMTAGRECVPVPMIVSGYENQPVMDGPCGFAWVNVRPGNSSFAIWLVKTGRARKAYGGGVQIWVRYFDQSYTRKSEYADAMADVFRSSPLTENLRIYAASRLD